MKKYSFHKAFTIVELLVVIVVIGILATITIIAYRGIAQKATEAAIVSDLSNSSKQFKVFQVESMVYPDTVSKCSDSPSTTTNKCIKMSGSNDIVRYVVNNSVTPQTFCITIKNGNTKKSIDQDNNITDIACTYPFAGTLSATTVSRSQINLSWTSITNATNYKVEKADNASFTGSTEIYSGTNTNTSSTGLTASTQYYYRVKVTIAGDDSNWSGTATATTSDFAIPSNLAVTARANNSISISWNIAAGATGYTIQRSTDSSFSANLVEVSNSGSGSVTHTAGSLAQSTGYYFRVRSTDATGFTSWSSTLSTSTILLLNFAYTGSVQTWTVPAGITSIQVEVWGAEGYNNGTLNTAGKGGYSIGTLSVTPGNVVYIYVGGQGVSVAASGGFNGGGIGRTGGSATEGSGGGASDIRYGGTALADRKIVAGGGGGHSGGYGGGLEGGADTEGGTAGGTQTSGYALGVGGAGYGVRSGYTTSLGGGGGGGYWGGLGGACYYASYGYGGGGGSGYIGGVTSAQTIAGNATMPNPAGGTMVGNAGNGYARITY